MKILIVYYSLTGHTKSVAQEIAARCHGDLDRIQDDGVQRSGVQGYLRSGWQAATGSRSPIRPSARRPANYDLVVLGTPVWNWSLSSPVRSYVSDHAHEMKRVAFFCTEGGSGDRRVFEELQRLCGRAPVATLAVTQKDLQPAQHQAELDRFVQALGAFDRGELVSH